MFNMWYAFLRSVIERTFRIWNKYPRYDIITKSVIFAIISLHNFIRQHNIKDSDIDNIDTNNDIEEAKHIENHDKDNNNGVRVEE